MTRPFIVEFKNRRSKGMRRKTGDGDLREPVSILPPSDENISVSFRRPDEDYLAALRAADILFGDAPNVPKELVNISPPLASPTEDSASSTERGDVRIDGQDQVVPGRKTKALSNLARSREKRKEMQSCTGAIDLSDKEIAPDVPTPHCASRMIQRRWVLGLELRAGEKWKRRLYKTIRRP